MRSNLIYNTSDRHERHECNTSATLATRVRHECDKSDIVRYKCCTNDTSATRVENFDFYNDTGKNIFSHPYICCMASERLQGEEQIHSKNYLLEMSPFHAFKKSTTKTKLFNGKSYNKKLYTRLWLQMSLHVPA